MDDGEHEVDGGAHVVGLEAADEGVEAGRGRADAQQERDLDEEDDEAGDAAGSRGWLEGVRALR